MDNKNLLAALKAHHFWLLLVVVIITATVVSSMGSSHVRQEFENQKRSVVSTFNGVLMARSGIPPNEDFVKRVTEVDNTLKTQVLEAWEVLYNAQRDHLHKWPETVAEIGNLPIDGEINSTLRERYRNLVVGPEWERLFSKLNLRRRVDETAARPAVGVPMGDDDPMESAQALTGLLVWDAGARKSLAERYSQPMQQSAPTTRRVRVTQEDMWIFDALFDIINTVNAEATDPGNAVIKRVDYLDIAQYAMNEASRDPGNAQLSTGAGRSTGSLGGSRSLSLSGTGEEGDRQLMNGRFIDQDLQPVADDAAEPFAEFRQMFVQMKFTMDQRKVPDLLAACANSPLLIETRQVRMEISDADRPRSATGQPSDPNRIEPGPFDATVEVRGIIYLYKEPSLEQLGTGAAANPAQRQFGIPVISRD